MEETTAREIKTFSLTLDMMRAMRSHPFEVVAGDTGNVLEVRLENDGVPVALAGRYVCMVFRSGIGTALQDTESGIALGEEPGTFSIALLPGSYGPGNVSADVQVYSGTDRSTLITSTRFTFRCRNALLSDETMRAQATYPPLIAATQAAQTATGQAVAAAQAAAGGEAARAAAEALRDGAEQQRQTGEAARQAAEAGRAAAEALRDEKVDEVYAAYTAGELKGDKGEKGDKGDKGDPGSYETHGHGNVTSAGAIGTAAGKLVVTGAGGLLTAGRTLAVGATEPSEMAASLGEGDVYIYCPTMAG
jgi:hypothetical protein